MPRRIPAFRGFAVRPPKSISPWWSAASLPIGTCPAAFRGLIRYQSLACSLSCSSAASRTNRPEPEAGEERNPVAGPAFYATAGWLHHGGPGRAPARGPFALRRDNDSRGGAPRPQNVSARRLFCRRAREASPAARAVRRRVSTKFSQPAAVEGAPVERSPRRDSKIRVHR